MSADARSSAAKKPSPEDELEKQYRDYKAQFDQWKEKNKGSIGTQAYDDYVEKFESWERDVEKRRALIKKQRAEAQAQAAAQAAIQAQKQAEEQAAQAVAYAQHQQQYLAHHQAALQRQTHQQAQQRAAMGVHQQQPGPFIQNSASPMVHSTAGGPMTGDDPTSTAMNPMAMMMQMMQMMIGSMDNSSTPGAPTGATPEPPDPVKLFAAMAAAVSSSSAGNQKVKFEGPQLPQQPAGPDYAAQQQQQIAQMPQLWGSDRIRYGPLDQMYRKWGMRAAPPYFKPAYKPPPPGTPVTPGWMVTEAMKQKRVMIAPQINVPPPPIIPFLSGVN